MMMIDRNQAQLLAALVHALRPDWDATGILAALRDAATHGTPYELAHAALHAAANPSNRTPAVIPLAGPHWASARTPGSTPRDTFDRCPEPGHQAYPATNCGYCRSEELEGARRAEPRRNNHEQIYATGAAAVRAALSASKTSSEGETDLAGEAS